MVRADLDLSSDRVQAVIRQSLKFLTGTLHAERALVLLGQPSWEQFAVVGSHGIETENFWLSGTVSTEILRRVRSEGVAELLSDAVESAEYGGRTSVVASGLRSVLAVPIKDPAQRVIGILYADSRLASHAFHPQDLQLALRVAQEAEKTLFPGPTADEAPRPGPTVAPSPDPPREPPAAPPPPA
ncbi:MAG: GAF domain-containing protein, partial [Candidatus Eremiobacterota bacterium]